MNAVPIACRVCRDASQTFEEWIAHVAQFHLDADLCHKCLRWVEDIFFEVHQGACTGVYHLGRSTRLNEPIQYSRDLSETHASLFRFGRKRA